MKISVIQMNSGDDIEKNLAQAEQLIREAVTSDGPELVALPEYFSMLTASPDKMRKGGESFAKVSGFLSQLAADVKVAIHAGSTLELADDKLYNTALVYDKTGEQIARYRKIHLFDAVLPDGTKIFESNTISRGESLVTYSVGSVICGVSICFDVRFPEMFRQLVDKNAHVILAPAAFTFATGADHWEVLLRARAIETQAYVIAPGQVFSFEGGKYSCWGHSMIIDPWGTVVAQTTNKVGFATAVIDLDYQEAVRQRIPTKANRFFV